MEITELYTREAHEAGAEMQVQDQYGKDMDAYITLMGCDSREFISAMTDFRRALLSGVNEAEAKAEALAKVTVSWRGFVSGDEEVPATDENILTLYKNAPYIVEQADNFSSARVNFTKGKASI